MQVSTYQKSIITAVKKSFSETNAVHFSEMPSRLQVQGLRCNKIPPDQL
jgi:hypothetical protein